jgi:glucose-1-phosphate adenylyltransferase
MSAFEYTPRFISKLTKNTLALVLAGGRGERLHQLTQWRTKPAVPFGGKYRIIDFALSNCVNSDIRQIGVISQYKAHSLIRHINKGWNFFRGEFGEFIELLPPQQRIENSWYRGTANAVYQNMDIIRSHHPDRVLVLGGDHIYKMDYGPMLAFHVDNQAQLTVGCVQVPVEEAKSFGVVRVDVNNRIERFAEKPSHPEAIPDHPDRALVSMGVYIFDTEFLIKRLIEDAGDTSSSHDFGRDIIPDLIQQSRVFAYTFLDGQEGKQAYWRDVGTVDSYWHANMELIDVIPELNLYDQEWPIWTYQEQMPPAKFVFDNPKMQGEAHDSMISEGCIISGAQISRSLLFTNVHVNCRSRISDSLILPDTVIGEDCFINRTIIDKGVMIADGSVIGKHLSEDAKRFHVSSEGVVLVTPDMLGQTLHYVR